MKLCHRIVLIFIEVIVVTLICYFVKDYITYHPKVINQGSCKYKISINGRYKLESKGLSELKPIFKKSVGMTDKYTIDSFQINLNRRGKVKSFDLHLEVYDKNNNHINNVNYKYSNYVLTYTLSEKDSSFVVEYNENSEIDNLDKFIKQIHLKKQIRRARKDLDEYVLRYYPWTYVEKGQPVYDIKDNKLKILSTKRYNNGEGGLSDGKTHTIFDLYDGINLASGQHYYFVFEPTYKEKAIGNQLSNLQGDYYINNGSLSFTRDYGENWISTDITKKELESTMEFYRNNLELPYQSVFISPDKKLPIAYFYNENPALKILPINSKKWIKVNFSSKDFYDLPIPHRVVGFVTSKFGYAALGTDHSMGCGESKMCYFTFDGGKHWDKKPLPLKGTNKTLVDMCMLNEKQGVVALNNNFSNDINEYYPLLYLTNDTGDNWSKIEMPYESLPQEVQFLTDIESLKYKDGKYVLVLGQGNESKRKVEFTSNRLTDGWKFSKIYERNIHTVG